MTKVAIPEKWCILKNDIPDHLWRKVVDYFNKNCNTDIYTVYNAGGFFYPNFCNGKGFLEGSHSGTDRFSSPYKDYDEISIEQFITQVLNESNVITNCDYLIPLLTKLNTI